MLSQSPDTGLPADNDWAQLAELRLKLQQHLTFHRHRYRGQDWYVVGDELSGQHFRCTATAHDFLRLLDGSVTVEQAFLAACDRHADHPPEQEEIIRLLATLQENDMLVGMTSDKPQPRQPQHRAGTATRIKQVLLRPLAIKIPLLDPDALLRRFAPLVRPLFSSTALVIWLILVSWAVLSMLRFWPELTAHWESRFFDLQNLLWLWLLYPLVKGLHELGHGLATRVWGGEVHEMGIMLLVFMPVPYVDASSSNAFANKHQRMVVAAAGILVELLIAALALLAWINLPTGLGRDLAFNIAFIGGASTLLFNGNPLLRFDGYYVLADALETPNLGTRANHYLGYLIKRYLLRLSNVRSPITAAGERGWLFTYSIASGLYRIFITFAIALYVAGKFFVVGMALAGWCLFTQIVIPVVKMIGRLIPQAIAEQRALHLTAVSGTALALLLGFLFWLPIPHSTHAEGIINLAEDAAVRAGADGFIRKVLRSDGEQVAAGQPLFQLEDSSIAARLELLAAREAELKAHHQAMIISDRNAAARARDELNGVIAERRELERQRDNLVITSPVAGRLALPQADNLPGRFVNKGDVLAQVVDFKTAQARVVVPQSDVNLVRRHTEALQVKVYSEPNVTLPATLLREVPSASEQLPSVRLGTQAGGDIAVDARDDQGIRTLNRVFHFDIALPEKASGDYLGQSIAVRFVHSNEPLGIRMLRRLRILWQQELQS